MVDIGHAWVEPCEGRLRKQRQAEEGAGERHGVNVALDGRVWVEALRRRRRVSDKGGDGSSYDEENEEAIVASPRTDRLIYGSDGMAENLGVFCMGAGVRT